MCVFHGSILQPIIKVLGSMIKTRLTRLVPKYTWLPLSLALALNCTVYFILRLFTRDAVHYDLSLPVDGAIPFLPPFVIIYVAAFMQWLVGYIVITRDSPELCCRVMAGEMISKLICAVFFIVMPTTMNRPEVAGDGLFQKLTRLIYYLDTPDNLFPSIHCLESWLCFRCALEAKKPGALYKSAMLVLTLLVFASTLFIKQHVLVDVLAGVLAAELGQALSGLLGAGRWLERLNANLFGESL